MEIIIEQVLFDNFFIDLIVLLLTNKILKLNAKKLNIFLGSVIGTIGAVILPLLYFNNILMWLFKISVGFCMVVVLKKFQSFREIVVAFLTILTLTFVFGGLCFAVLIAINKRTDINSLVIGKYSVPVGVCILVVLIYWWLFEKLLNYIKSKNILSKFTYDIQIQVKEQVFSFKAYLDSGNRLTDEDGKDVSLISLSCFNKINKTFKNFSNIHFIKTRSAVGENAVMVFEVDKLIIKKENEKIFNKNALIGVSENEFKNFDCLLNCNTLKYI